MKCQSCGRTSSQTYCNECTDQEGKLKSFEEVTENLTSYYVETQGFDSEVAKSVAIGILSHQPAWEAKLERIEKGKDMRMKTFLIATAVVFTVVGAGIAWWFGTRTKADEITTNNFAKSPISPLEQIQERKVGDDMVVYEFKAPGDQNILDFNNSILTFESLDGTANSPKSTIYNYDVYNRIGFPFDPNSMDTKFLMDGRNDYLQLDRNYNNQTSPSGSVVSFDMDFEAHDAPSSWLYDPIRGELRKDISVYCQGDNLIVWDSSKLNTEYEKYIWNTKNNVKSPTRDGDALVNLGKRYYVCSSGNKIIIHDLETAKVTRFDASSYLQNNVQSTIVANDNYVCISSLNYAIAGKTGTFVYDIKNNTFKKMFDEFMDNLSINQNVDASDTIVAFAAYSNSKIKFGYFRPWEAKPKSVYFEENERPSSKQWAPLLKVNKNSIIWDFNEETKFDPTPIGSCDLNPKAPYKENKIHVYDTISNKDSILETDNRGEVFMFGDYLAWTKWDGKENDQYINVCFSPMPPQELVDRKQYDNEGKPPFSNITVKNNDGFEIRELNAKGDQNLEFNFRPDNLTSCLIFQSWNKSLKEFEYWAFDLDSEKGVLLDPGNFETLNFLSKYEQDLFWPSSDCTKVNKYDHINKKIVQVEQPVEFGDNNSKRYITKLGINGDELMVTDTKTGETNTIWKGKGEIDFSSSMIGDNNNIVTFRIIVGDEVKESFVYIIPLKKMISTGDGLIYDNCSERYYVWERFINDDEYYAEKPFRSKRSIHVLDIMTGQQFEIKPEQNNIYEYEHVSLFENLQIIGGKTPEETYILWPTANIVDGNLFQAVGYTSVADIGKTYKEFKANGKSFDMLFYTVVDDWLVCGQKSTDKSMLVAKNLASGEERVLDDNTTGSSIIKVGDYFVWEAFRFSDHQFQNICYAKIK